MTDTPKKPKGFAALSPERRKAVSASGGAAVPADKRSFSTKPGLAADAGRIGGSNSRRTPRDKE